MCIKSIADHSNPPLTHEQLLQMDGEPYWHESLQGGTDGWKILPTEVAKRPQDYHYGDGWLAYAHKPAGKEEQDGAK